MAIKLALAGNPNCGKTTMFNDLTGANQYVGNWPGVTVEKKEGKLRGHKDVVVTDLPGIYSLSPYTLEEVVTRDYIMNEHPSVIMNLVDGSNIERNLYLTTQITEMGIPVVIALNMMDVVRKNGDRIDTQKLAAALGCEVVETSAVKGEGSKRAADRAVQMAQEGGRTLPKHIFAPMVEEALDRIQSLTAELVPAEKARWYAVKLFERDGRVLDQLKLSAEIAGKIEEAISACEKAMDDDSESIITNERYQYVAKIVRNCVHKNRTGMTSSDKIDRIVTNRILALPIFAVVMFAIYGIAMGGYSFSIGTMGADWANDVLFGEIVPGAVDAFLGMLGVSGWLYSLIQDGIVAGVGAVLGFVPQMLVLFLLLAILEDVGYMARVAFIMDRIFRKFGLSGKSFIPMLVATGCGVPGIMASRTIEQDRDRKITIMTTGFIPCGAKMPIIGLFAGAVFGNSPWVATSAFFIGIAAVIISGVMLKKFKIFAGEPAPFVMELPAYHAPSPGNVLRATWERGWSFIKRAGTIILLSSMILWFLQGYGVVEGVFQAVEDNSDSLLALIGNGIAWIFAPLGWVGDMAWKATVATITGLIAKEEVVNTFGVLYQYAGQADLLEDSHDIWAAIGADFGVMSAYSFMVFNLLCAPCFAAMGAIRREMNNARWTMGAIGYMCLFAYVTSMIVFQLGGLITGEASFGLGTVVAAVLLAGIFYLLFRRGYQGEDIIRMSAVETAEVKA